MVNTKGQVGSAGSPGNLTWQLLWLLGTTIPRKQHLKEKYHFKEARKQKLLKTGTWLCTSTQDENYFLQEACGSKIQLPVNKVRDYAGWANHADQVLCKCIFGYRQCESQKELATCEIAIVLCSYKPTEQGVGLPLQKHQWWSLFFFFPWCLKYSQPMLDDHPCIYDAVPGIKKNPHL